ncbi:poly-beta-1,6-N-acetyl-D-glucosamine synthase [Pectobacterium peruviense]|uniref:Poly-beta-1,6-N-acetyl-D-glucosamine synthase n=1 Tax=Pectobacterium peruviense TaxID=2066479 RepID=A0ABX4S674_9GAMM|nr:poly-beta-1,6-N-acetyl-D-glucosamine synthase [Pectobacterium peruviense]KML64658.1 N-glycosyltransferase [Pectobacterium peruviense]PKX80893.1 poly-beta-1,6 N-acetyl-D-glucosamine synthase [Pectobacterium peruviense]PKX86014.1 poly-beta-1,6 N-acetyl-D-glucosamine synthase [Pectobacterium peruviense]
MIERILASLILCLMLGIPFGVMFSFTGDVVLNFTFFWPLFMSGLWITGGLYFWFHYERHWRWGEGVIPDEPTGRPLVSILIPCYNEGPNVRETIEAALAQRYTHIEVIAVNDGSNDDTGDELNRLAEQYDKLRVIHLAHNQGKALALQAACAAAKSDLLVCIDGDALLDPDAVAYLVNPLINNPRVGAVTGNPRIRTRSTLVGRIQVGEFSSIIGLIKRTQRVYGKVFTVSGVIAAFRRSALAEVGYWSSDMITEDIDISWKLQLRHWTIFFEPRALCWILMPEKLSGLWKQRLRWAQGGAEVFLKNFRHLWSWRYRRMWPLFLEYSISILWAFTYAVSVLLYLLGFLIELPEEIRVETLFPPAFTGMMIGVVCLIQFAVSMLIERRYEKDIGKYLFWVIWYPMVYWTLSLFTSLVSFPKVMLRSRKKRARWESPDRGIERG